MLSRSLSSRISTSKQEINCTDNVCWSTAIIRAINVDLLGGALMVIVGFISQYRFKGRRMILAASSILLLALWNTIWAIFSEIYQFESPFGGDENRSFTENDLSLFDTIMFRGESALTFMVYQLIIIAGPLDISRMHDLQKN